MAAPITKLRIGLQPDTPEEHTRLLINVNTEEAQTSLQITTDLRVRANPATAKIYYYNFDGSELLYTETIEPGRNGSWNGEPGRASTQQYEYIFNGWSTEPDQVDPTEDATAGVYSARRVYAAYKRRDISGFVKFSADYTFNFVASRSEWDGQFLISTDAVEWETPTASMPYPAKIQKNGRYEIYCRGIGNTKLSKSNITNHVFTFNWGGGNTPNIIAEGDARALLDYESALRDELPPMGDYAFYHLFASQLNFNPRITLPFKSLTPYCFAFMFAGCGIEEAPELPATTLAIGCYQNMFNGCSKLETVPELPATTLAKYCYEGMFASCANLTLAPALPAASATEGCYRNMFSRCLKLKSAPELPATTLATGCYKNMFNGCTSLKDPPNLPAQNIREESYADMFNGCGELETPPELPAMTLAKNCYARMFQNCRKLKYPPALPSLHVQQSSYQSMFMGCISIASLPELPTVALPYGAYWVMFSGCTSLKISEVETAEYSIPFRIPSDGTGTFTTNSLVDMFANTGGTFTGTPAINTTYYLAPPAST